MPGETNRVMPQGNLIYIKAANGNFYPAIGNTAGYQLIGQREYFEFRPGQTALSGGAVVSGTRTGALTTTSGTVASSTYWGSWINYSPLRTGYIDGKTSGGIIEGQLTVGLAVGAGTGKIAPTAQIANTANTAAPTTFLALATTVTCTTAEAYATYDINYLACDTVFNSVPFSVRMGVQHSQGGSTAIFRIMESSAVRGYYEAAS